MPRRLDILLLNEDRQEELSKEMVAVRSSKTATGFDNVGVVVSTRPLAAWIRQCTDDDDAYVSERSTQNQRGVQTFAGVVQHPPSTIITRVDEIIAAADGGTMWYQDETAPAYRQMVLREIPVGGRAGPRVGRSQAQC